MKLTSVPAKPKFWGPEFQISEVWVQTKRSPGRDLICSLNHCYPTEEPDAREVVALIKESGRKAIAVPGDLREEAFCQKLAWIFWLATPLDSNEMHRFSIFRPTSLIGR
jgi:hypothetical protein